MGVGWGGSSMVDDELRGGKEGDGEKGSNGLMSFFPNALRVFWFIRVEDKGTKRKKEKRP